jgi:hypothetical protein
MVAQSLQVAQLRKHVDQGRDALKQSRLEQQEKVL